MTLMKTWLPPILSFLLFATAIYWADAQSAGSPASNGASHAAVFGTVFIAFVFPLTVGAGYLLRALCEFLLRRRLPWRSALPWFAHLPLTVLLLLVTLVPDTPQSLYRRYISPDVPQSLSDFQYWHASGFGNSSTLLAFRIDPREFPKVLAAHPYRRMVLSGEEHPLERYGQIPDFPISPPPASLVEVYSYSEPGTGGGLYLTHYTTEHHDYVLTIRSFN